MTIKDDDITDMMIQTEYYKNASNAEKAFLRFISNPKNKNCEKAYYDEKLDITRIVYKSETDKTELWTAIDSSNNTTFSYRRMIRSPENLPNDYKDIAKYLMDNLHINYSSDNQPDEYEQNYKILYSY